MHRLLDCSTSSATPNTIQRPNRIHIKDVCQRLYWQERLCRKRILQRSCLAASHTPPAIHVHGTPLNSSDLGLSLQQEYKIDMFLDFLLEENQKYNMTAVRDKAAAFERHVLDSLALLPPLEEHAPATDGNPLNVLDVGSGPGLPGCILAIARPQWKVRWCPMCVAAQLPSMVLPRSGVLAWECTVRDRLVRKLLLGLRFPNAHVQAFEVRLRM
jgi:hypothetical protein